MTYSPARQVVLDVLTAIQPPLPGDPAILPYARDLRPSRPTVMVRADKITPGPQQITRQYHMALIAVTPLISPDGPADDALDALTDALLAAIDRTQLAIVWTSAERGVHGEYPAYELTITVDTVHERD